jgi:hypothetical protein
MDCTITFSHNVYIDDTLVGYIGSNHDGSATIYIHGNKLAELSSEGIISNDGKKFGHIDDNGDVYLHDILVGEIDEHDGIRFFGSALSGAIKG